MGKAEIERIKSETRMSYHSCNKADYHHRVKQLESQLTAAKERERVLVEAIKKVEWSASDDYLQTNCCPICKAGIQTSWKHKKQCVI